MTRWPTLLVWTGGALFATSLAITAYAFLVLWGEARPLETDWLRSAAANALLITLFAFHHSLFARERPKAWLAQFIQPHLLRSVYVWVASVLLIGAVWAWQPLGGALYHVTGPIAWLLRGVQFAGIALIAASVRAIDALELAGIRSASSGTPLYVKGPYGLVRHPLYLGWVLIVFGTSQMTGDRLAFAVLTTTYLVVAMPWEERSLVRTYGDAYRLYMQRVRWRLLPLLY